VTLLIFSFLRGLPTVKKYQDSFLDLMINELPTADGICVRLKNYYLQ